MEFLIIFFIIWFSSAIINYFLVRRDFKNISKVKPQWTVGNRRMTIFICIFSGIFGLLGWLISQLFNNEKEAKW